MSATGCLHAQKPVRFSGPAALDLDAVAREMIAMGHETGQVDVDSGILHTTWQNLSAQYGSLDPTAEMESSIYRRYTVILSVRPAETDVVVRTDLRRCPPYTKVSGEGTLPGSCQPFPGILEQFQEELDQLGEQLRASLSRVQKPPKPDKDVPVVAVFDLQAPPGLLSEGEDGRMADYLATKLTETGLFKVVPRDKMRDAIRQRQKESHAHAYGTEFQVELGRAVAAGKLLITQLVGGGKACTLASSLYDLTSETAEHAATVQAGCSSDELLKGIEQLARQLADRVR
jgi:hypothetical protein